MNNYNDSTKHDKVTLQALGKSVNCPDYFRNQFLTRFFNCIDTKKDNYIDVEEFIVAITLFRMGTDEELIKGFFLVVKGFQFYMPFSLTLIFFLKI